MSAIYFEALKMLPQVYISDNTHAVEFKGMVIVVSEGLPSIMFNFEGARFWRRMEVIELPIPTVKRKAAPKEKARPHLEIVKGDR